MQKITDEGLREQIDHIQGWCTAVKHSPCWYEENITGKNLEIYEEDKLAKEALMALISQKIGAAWIDGGIFELEATINYAMYARRKTVKVSDLQKRIATLT